MPTRIGLELSPVAYRVVEVDSGFRPRRAGSEIRVRSFARMSRSDGDVRAMLAPLKGRNVSVVAWGLPSDHRQAVVTRGSYERMRREAVEAAGDAGVDTRGMIADVAPAAPRVKGSKRCTVALALAERHDVMALVGSLREAGLRVQSLVTPALALMSLARSRRVAQAAAASDVYIALEETATAMVLLRDGGLVADRELTWGYQRDARQTRGRDEVAARLADEIAIFLDSCGVEHSAISQICICGGMPELRSMTVLLMEGLDVEVETLDSLFGIDASRLPQPAGEFRDHTAELRLAWAVATDRQAPLNLLRPWQRQRKRTTMSRAAAAAGLLTCVGGGWRIQQSDWWRSEKPKPEAAARQVSPAVRPATPAPGSSPSVGVVSQAQPVSPEAKTAVAPGAPTAPRVIEAPRESPAGELAPGPRARPVVVAPRPEVSRPSTARAPEAAMPASAAPTVAARPAAVPPVAAVNAGRPAAPVTAALPAPVVDEPVAGGPRPQVFLAPRRAQPAETAERRVQPEPSLPFDASLGSILYAPERKLALIDSRIVQIGDVVRGATVVDITPTAVLLRDAQRRLRRLELGVAGR